MEFDLLTFDWTALGSIATTIAMIIAYCSIRATNKENEKSRRLQILLLRKEQEQKNLDEMIENVLDIAFSIRPIDILNYSTKFQNHSFTTQDRYEIENIQHIDRMNSVKLNVQMSKLANYENAKPFLAHLGNIRKDFNLWAQSINLLFLLLNDCPKTDRPNDMIKKIINDMKQWYKEVTNPYYITNLNSIQKNIGDDMKECYNILSIFESELSSQISDHIHQFENEFYKFVEIEQRRINDIVK